VLVYADGKTEIGLLLQDQIQGVAPWRWVSDKDLSDGSIQRKHQAEIAEEWRKDLETSPGKMVGCGLEGPKTVYTTNTVCYAILKFFQDNQSELKPYAGYAFLQECASLDTRTCMAIIDVMRSLAATAHADSKMTLTEKRADQFQIKFSGNDRPHYMNACQDLVGYFK
jgi:hypothetical protein